MSETEKKEDGETETLGQRAQMVAAEIIAKLIVALFWGLMVALFLAPILWVLGW